MKVFERLLKKHICSSIPATLDPLQFAYRPNRSTDDAISQVLHSSLTHIDSKNGNYVRLLFIDYSSAFNTIVPHQASCQTLRSRPKHFTLWLDSRFPHRQTTSGESRPVHLQLHHPEYRSPNRAVSWAPCSTLYTPTTACPLTAQLLLSNLRMILWFWASLTMMTRPHTWMRWRDSHHGARTTVSLWTWAKLKSWL